jgi:hypothetical protein
MVQSKRVKPAKYCRVATVAGRSRNANNAPASTVQAIESQVSRAMAVTHPGRIRGGAFSVTRTDPLCRA